MRRNVGTLGGRELLRFGLGCMTMSHPGRDDEGSVRTLRAAADAGIQLFDTADRYGRGHNEELLARAFEGRRDDVVLATKLGFVGKSADEAPVDGSPAHVRRACDASLRRLRTDHVDLLYLHRVDPRVPIEETVGEMAELVRRGKALALGLSEVAASTLRRAHAVHPIAAVQSEYSLWSRDPEQHVLTVCRELGAAFVAYSPLGAGFLTGRYRSPEQLPPGSNLAKAPRMADGNLERNLRLVEELDQLSSSLGCSPAQLALAWVLAQGVFVIPSSARREHLEENLGALDVELDADFQRRLDVAFRSDAVAGPRKGASGLALTNS